MGTSLPKLPKRPKLLKAARGVSADQEAVERRRQRLEDADSRPSEHTGVRGWAERGLRQFRTFSHCLALAPLYLLLAGVMAGAALPGLWLWRALGADAGGLWPRAAALGGGFVLGGFALGAILPLLNALLGCRRIEPFRGPYYSLPAIRWYIHNGILYVYRYTFLPFLTPSPLNVLFYRAMGMRVGEGTLINSECLSDPCLIELGRKVTIGGSVTILGHYGVGGYLVVRPVVVGEGVTVGFGATLMGGVEIGAFARILPHSVVLPNQKVPPGETWGGVPAKKIE